MGWWSTDVMSGDSPLDCLDGFERDLGVTDLYPFDAIEDDRRSALATVLTATVQDQLLVGSADAYDKEIAIQVLGSLVMAAGVPMTDVVRLAAIEAAERDPWALSGDADRQHAMAAFAMAVRSYEGVRPVVLHHTGLFAKLAAIQDPDQ